VLALVAVLAVAGAVLALRLEPSAGTGTLVGSGSDSFQATERYHERFGDDAVVILVRGDLQRLVLTQDLERMLGLEGCISGKVPRNVDPPGGPQGPCAALATGRPAQVVYGPGTFINEAVRQLQEEFRARQTANARKAKKAGEDARKLAASKGRSRPEQAKLGKQAEKLVEAEFVRDSLQIAVRYGIKDLPRVNDPDFVSSLVFDPSRGPRTPKARFAYLFPNSRSALIQVRLRPNLSDAERGRAIEQIRAAVRMPNWRLSGASYVVTGAPVVVADLSTSFTGSIAVLLVAALLVMAATLALVFRTRMRLLPLGVALAAAGLTFGGMALAGASLTMASIAVLPVLLGLAVDYAIQLQSRWDEERRRRRRPEQVVAAAAALGAPTIATAALATATGFLVLLLSPVPMVRGFGVLLVVGIVLAFACALTAGFAALTLGATDPRTLPPRLATAYRLLAPSFRGARAMLSDAGRTARAVLRPVRERTRLAAGPEPATRVRAASARAGRWALREALTRPQRVLGIALAVAALGWVADTQTEVVSDVQRLVPQDLPALTDLRTLQNETGVSGEIDVTVEGRDLTDPAVIGWMSRYQQRVLRRFGYSSERGCGRAALCPALSLPDLFRSNTRLTRPQIRSLLAAVPPYFSQAVMSPDRRTATMAFGIRLMPLDRQQQVIEQMREELDPPNGVRAQLAGLPVLAAEANAAVSSPWRRALFLIAGLVAVALVLFGVYRRWERALVPLVPIALATGWSALILFAIRIPLNPMSATLGALVIAISTEFAVLLAARYEQERSAGHAPRAALERTYSSTGAAVLASGVTAIAGFAVLVVSDIRMLRDFGFVTVVDLTVSLLGVMVVLPAVLVLAERGELMAGPVWLVQRARELLRRARERMRWGPRRRARAA